MLCSVRNLSLASVAVATGLLLAAPALAIPPDIASRHARRAAEERNSLRQEAEAVEEAEEIPADAEVMDDAVEQASAQEPIGTGTRRSSVRQAAYDESRASAPPRRSARPMPEYAQRASRE